MTTFNVGDILSASYTYNSRHNHFYVVTKRTAKTISLQRVYSQTVSDDGYGQNGTEVALVIDNVPQPMKGEDIITRRVKLDREGNEIAKYNDYYSYLRKWTGRELAFYTD